jgi:hypothetical protein
MIKIFSDQISDGELNGYIMDVIQIFENHETYDIGRPLSRVALVLQIA